MSTPPFESAEFRFFILEDQTILRELLRTHLQKEFPKCTIVEAKTLAEARTAMSVSEAYDLAIVDLELPDGNALDWIISWMQGNSQRKALILSSVREDYVLYRALHSNVPGFVHKNDDTEVLRLAIRSVLAGGMFFSSTVQKMRTRIGADPVFFNKVLSEREQEALVYLGKGLSNEEVAEYLGLKASSVQDHRKHIMNKLGIHSQAELMRYAVEKGFSKF
ncbi:MAG TPA: response regulator transcription factor [Opitutaceae bacterium]|nr:response regulator transcription factor [Opitutaceae bacterium]